MRAVRDMNGLTTLINRDEARVFNKIDLENFVSVNTLSERDHFLAEEMYKRNVLQKVEKEHSVGYKIYPQKTVL
jgi:hypothetical protein